MTPLDLATDGWLSGYKAIASSGYVTVVIEVQDPESPPPIVADIIAQAERIGLEVVVRENIELDVDDVKVSLEMLLGDGETALEVLEGDDLGSFLEASEGLPSGLEAVRGKPIALDVKL